MPSRIFRELLIEQIEIFKYSFTSVSRSTFYSEKEDKLVHAGEFGVYREAICRDFLRFVIPARLDLGQGFVINANDEISHQCDIVVYDPSVTPLIQNESRQRFFPIETVCAVGEVKSTLSRTELSDALKKLVKVKEMRENIRSPSFERGMLAGDEDREYDPTRILTDQVFTFVICEGLNFNILHGQTDALYDANTPHGRRHNIILSIKDGVAAYHHEKDNKVLPWPWSLSDDGDDGDGEGDEEPTPLSHYVLAPSAEDPNSHFKVFAHAMFLATSVATILFPELGDYMGFPEGNAFSQPSRGA